MEIIDDLVDLGLDIIPFVNGCILLGSWWEVQEYFDVNFRIQDAVYTIWGIAKRYLNEGLDNYYVAIMLTLKKMFVRFKQRDEYEDILCYSF